MLISQTRNLLFYKTMGEHSYRKGSLFVYNSYSTLRKLKHIFKSYHVYFMFLTLAVVFSTFGSIISSNCAEAAAVYYVRADASGYQNGTDWANAYKNLPSTLVRGATYYIADGSYGSYTFDDGESGSAAIIIKKATISDHGSETSWNSSYGDGQAVFDGDLIFSTGYYVFDGNGTHTIPSDDTKDYGFKISSNSSTNTTGIIKFGTAGNTPTHITLKYTHVYNTTNGDINNGTVGLRFYPGQTEQYIKVQNCYLQNSGKDGIQISQSQYILVERCYVKRYGRLYAGSPDYHGQTVQIFYGGDNIIFRWNVWEANEGQGLIQIAGINSTSENIRFYGNIVFVGYGQTSATPGFNVSGGVFGNAWSYNAVNGVYVYNNTYVNIGGDYGGVARKPNIGPHSNWYNYNDLYYNCESVTYSGWEGFGYMAVGGGDVPGGSNEQTGLSSSIFSNYTENDFSLSTSTTAGLDLTSEGWWDTSDSFFGYLDSADDMFGNTRGEDGTWDRGALEYTGTNNGSQEEDPDGTANIIPGIPANPKIIITN